MARAEFRVLDFEPRCPDCAVAVGELHVYDENDGGCDVGTVTGLQRLMCDADHDCGRNVWTGWWPGQLFSELRLRVRAASNCHLLPTGTSRLSNGFGNEDNRLV